MSPVFYAPKAKKWKKAKHTMRVIFPFFQFILVIGIFGLLSHCSPLAPSTDKNQSKINTSIATDEPSDHARQASEDSFFSKQKFSIPTMPLQIVSESDFDAKTRGAIQSENKILTKSLIQNRIGIIKYNNALQGPIHPFLLIQLNELEQKSLLSKGSVHINLGKKIRFENEEARKFLFTTLASLNQKNEIHVSGLIVPKHEFGTWENDQKTFEIQADMAADKDHAIMEIRRADAAGTLSDDASHLYKSLEATQRFTIVLE